MRKEFASKNSRGYVFDHDRPNGMIDLVFHWTTQEFRYARLKDGDWYPIFDYRECIGVKPIELVSQQKKLAYQTVPTGCKQVMFECYDGDYWPCNVDCPWKLLVKNFEKNRFELVELRDGKMLLYPGVQAACWMETTQRRLEATKNQQSKTQQITTQRAPNLLQKVEIMRRSLSSSCADSPQALRRQWKTKY